MRVGAMVMALPMLFALAGCSRMTEATVEAPAPRPEAVLDFHTLYGANCQACHGVGGHGGPAMELGNPEYQALVDDATLRKWISGGMPGTEMPAFARSAGGFLTDQQIGAIIARMRKEWARPNAFGGATPPAYAQGPDGDLKRGQATYQARCASCHQNPAREQVTSAAYLSLVRPLNPWASGSQLKVASPHSSLSATRRTSTEGNLDTRPSYRSGIGSNARCEPSGDMWTMSFRNTPYEAPTSMQLESCASRNASSRWRFSCSISPPIRRSLERNLSRVPESPIALLARFASR